jgi:DNA-binding CsgD family transcriptional regulator
MAARGSRGQPPEFTKEFRIYSSAGRFSESFFEKLDELARSRVMRRGWRPARFGLLGEKWDKETIHDLAMDFLLNHLVSEARLHYVLEKAEEGNVDYLMIQIFDQFLAESAQRRSPHVTNLRRRIKAMLSLLSEEGKIMALSDSEELWASKNSPSGAPLALDELIQKVPNLPAPCRIYYDGDERVSPVISERDLKALLSSVFDSIREPVSLDTLTGFLCHHLGVWDARFEAMELFQPGEQETREWPFPDQKALRPDMGEAEARVEIKKALQGLSPRQMEIFRLYYTEQRSVMEICIIMSLGKSVVYQELASIERALTQKMQ